MAAQFKEIRPSHQALIAESPMFFVATAAPEGRVNLSPKGMNSLRVLDPNRVIWFNFTGSGNETAGHLLQSPRMTLMWCSFTEKPLILRAYGTARAVHPGEAGWADLIAHFDPDPAIRQIFDMTVEMAQTSCGTAVPFMEFKADRHELEDWAAAKGPAGLHAYRAKKNVETIDGFPTGLVQSDP